MPVAIRQLVPLLFVEDIVQSAAFYQERLGFEMTQTWEPDGKLAWCTMVRGGSAVMLQQALPDEDGPAEGRGRGVGFFFICDDASAMHADFTGRGLVVAPPKTAFYGMNQLFVKDLDGYELCFQSEIDKDS